MNTGNTENRDTGGEVHKFRIRREAWEVIIWFLSPWQIVVYKFAVAIQIVQLNIRHVNLKTFSVSAVLLVSVART